MESHLGLEPIVSSCASCRRRPAGDGDDDPGTTDPPPRCHVETLTSDRHRRRMSTTLRPAGWLQGAVPLFEPLEWFERQPLCETVQDHGEMVEETHLTEDEGERPRQVPGHRVA